MASLYVHRDVMYIMPCAVPRAFHFDSYQQRHVALEVFYAGWDYHGFASQTARTTVEARPSYTY
jgi:hypothetical protein